MKKYICITKIKGYFNCLYNRWTKDSFNCMKLLFPILLVFTLTFPMTCFAAADESKATDNANLTILIRVGKDIVLQNEYSLSMLQSLPKTRQSYTSMDGDETPQLILAEGVLITDLLKHVGADQKELKSINIYCTDGTVNGFIRNFLYGVNRYSYPNLAKAWLEEQEGKTDTAEKMTTTAGAIKIEPMLAIQSYEKPLAVTEDWSQLSRSDGYRMCYGQLSPTDVCSTLYGRQINKLEIILDEKSNFGKTEEQIKNSSAKGIVSNTVKDSADDVITGAVKDSVTGEVIDTLPSTLTINVGYFGTKYYTRKVFTMAELRGLPRVKQTYTLIDSSNAVVVETAEGVRLTDLMAAAGIDINSVENFYFYTADSPESPRESMSKMYLIDTPKYFYPRLPLCWNNKTGSPTSGAAAGRTQVDTILALKDYWKQSATAPDFYKVKSNSRFRLVFGQANTTGQTASRCINWVNAIEVQLGGTPPTTTGNGIAGSSGKSRPKDNVAENLKDKESNEKVKVVLKDDSLNENARGWHMYEIADNVQGLPEDKHKTSNLFIALLVLIILLSGAGTKCIEYRKEQENI